MILKTGKDEILYLLNEVIDKLVSETGTTISRNTNRQNYEAVAVRLSGISNNLPSQSSAAEKKIH